MHYRGREYNVSMVPQVEAIREAPDGIDIPQLTSSPSNLVQVLFEI